MMRPQDLPENGGALRYLAQGPEPADVAVVAPPSAGADVLHLGAHPDVVEWLWSKLNTALPGDARSLVAGGAALVDRDTGLILAAALGTQYAIRLSGAGLAEARRMGYETSHTFRSVDRTLDLAATFGPGWHFGRFDGREGEWLAETCRAPNL
jgi:hypothetical protein